MEQRAFVINFVTVIFVAVTLYFLFKNNNLHAIVQKDFVAQSVATSPSENSPNVPSVITPGPLMSDVKTFLLSTSVGTLTREGIITDTNTQRSLNGFKMLSESVQLDASAQVKANDILARQYFEHTAPDGVTVVNLVGDQGYAYIRVGENLALGAFADDDAVVTAWMDSPGHRANILDPMYTDIGVGVAKGTYKGQHVVVAVQHFGRPASSCPAVDASLKKSITDGQTKLTNLSNSLDTLKTQLDSERGSGEDVTSLVDSYNTGIDSYNADYDAVEKIRATYNSEVVAFNTCMTTNP